MHISHHVYRCIVRMFHQYASDHNHLCLCQKYQCFPLPSGALLNILGSVFMLIFSTSVSSSLFTGKIQFSSLARGARIHSMAASSRRSDFLLSICSEPVFERLADQLIRDERQSTGWYSPGQVCPHSCVECSPAFLPIYCLGGVHYARVLIPRVSLGVSLILQPSAQDFMWICSH
jgi:hypothetical protein